MKKSLCSFSTRCPLGLFANCSELDTIAIEVIEH